MSFKKINGDITKVEADAIVNSANPYPICGGSTEALIYEAAGYEKLLEARQKIGYLDVCEAKHTPAFEMKAKYLIHVSSPRWNDGHSGEEASLKVCYRNALEEAYKLGCQSIAFPLLSSGVYRFPKEIAILTATEAIREFLLAGADEGRPDRSSMEVILVLYDPESIQISEALFDAVQSYVEKHYEPIKRPRILQRNVSLQEASIDRFKEKRRLCEESPKKQITKAQSSKKIDQIREAGFPSNAAKKEKSVPDKMLLQEIYCDSMPLTSKDAVKGLDDIFDGDECDKDLSDRIIEIMNEKGLTPSLIQRNADIDRKLYSKILKKGYSTTKPTVIALAIGLQLDYQESKDFLALAGYALSPAIKSDLIVRFFMENKELYYRTNADRNKYKVYQLNDLLLQYGLDTLGAGRRLKPAIKK